MDGTPTQTQAAPTQQAAVASVAQTAPQPTQASSTPNLANAAEQVDWRSSLPEDLRSNPAIAKYKDVAELAKGHVNAQALIGKKGLEKPSDDWKPEQWDSFYKEIGRPEKFEDYKFESQLPEGFNKDEGMEKYFAERMHKAGLSQKQASSLHQEFVNFQAETYKQQRAKMEQEQAMGYSKLKQEFGDNFPAYEEAAYKAAKEYGGSELAAVLRQYGLESHPVLLKTFGKMGMQMTEDTLKSGRGGDGNAFAMGKGAALAEISKLKQDDGFLKVFNDTNHPGFKDAMKRWNDLHKLAFS